MVRLVQRPLGYEVRDVQVSAGEEVAFSHSMNHVQANTNDGKSLDKWWRATLCYRRQGNDWLVTHSHTSVPFDMTTGAASLDLKP
jgi:ketosteroid isomerase-like protein